MRATARVSARTPPPLGIRRESTQYAYSASSLHNLLHLRFANSRSSVGVFFVFLIKPSARSASSGGNTESSELPFGLAEANVPPYFRLRTSGMPIGQPNCTRIQSRPIVRLSPLSTSCLGLVPRLRRSDHLRNDTQPLRAGLTFGGRPSGPRIHADFAASFLCQLPRANWLLPRQAGAGSRLLTSKERAALTSAAATEDGGSGTQLFEGRAQRRSLASATLRSG